MENNQAEIKKWLWDQNEKMFYILYMILFTFFLFFLNASTDQDMFFVMKKLLWNKSDSDE